MYHPSFRETVTQSSQWKLWEKEQERRMKILASRGSLKSGVYDMPEVIECGWISQKHFQDFLKFAKEI